MICKKCKGLDVCLAITGTESHVDGLCKVCREEPLYGTPLAMSAKLKLRAAAMRAQNPDEPRILCMNCEKEWARDFWYVCSTECRDQLTGRHAPPLDGTPRTQ